MKKKGQSSIEYILAIVIALVVILVLLRTFFDPRTGTIKKVGTQQNVLESEINKTINNIDG